MRLCISCRGEYWVPTQGEQTSKAQTVPGPPTNTGTAATTYMADLYGLQELLPCECARCRQSNERWHWWTNKDGLTRFNRFFLRSLPWGWLGALSFLLPLFAANIIDFTPVASEQVGVPLAVFLIFVNVALLYALKDSLWRYDLLARVTRGFRPPLALLSVITVVLALVLGLVIVFLLEARTTNPELTRTEGLTRVVTTIILALTFVNVTLAAMFMAGHDYGNWLNQEMPQPIYAQERRLWSVINVSIEKQIRHATSSSVAVKTIITNLERDSDGGITVLLDAETDLKEADMKQLHSWTITADRWGRIIKVSREGTPRYIAIEKSAEDSSPTDKTEQTNNLALPTSENSFSRGFLLGGYRTESDTSISMTSSRKYWKE